VWYTQDVYLSVCPLLALTRSSMNHRSFPACSIRPDCWRHTWRPDPAARRAVSARGLGNGRRELTLRRGEDGLCLHRHVLLTRTLV